jgi:hypothetical protein
MSRNIYPSVRAWDETTLTTKNGVRFRIFGAEAVGEGVGAVFDDGARLWVAHAGDYVYPHEVRFDSVRGRVYVRADGLRPLENREETWLFEYDADHKRGLEALRVDPHALPPACADKPKLPSAG